MKTLYPDDIQRVNVLKRLINQFLVLKKYFKRILP